VSKVKGGDCPWMVVWAWRVTVKHRVTMTPVKIRTRFFIINGFKIKNKYTHLFTYLQVFIKNLFQTLAELGITYGVKD